MRMFGGFSSKFFERYHELVPKSEPANEYEQRMQLYEAFHHLNHALIFGVRSSVRTRPDIFRAADFVAPTRSRAATRAARCRCCGDSWIGRTRRGCRPGGTLRATEPFLPMYIRISQS